MRKGLFFGSLVVVVVTGGALIAYLNAPVAHAITGYVEDRRGPLPDGVVVTLTRKAGADDAPASVPAPVTKPVAGNGWFAFTDLADGRYHIEARWPDGRSIVVSGLSPGNTARMRREN